MKMNIRKYTAYLIFILLLLFEGINTSELFNANDEKSPSKNNNILSRIKREIESLSSPTTNRRTKLYGEITEDGIIYNGGYDLPEEFKGSGTSDFAFDGPSFRYWNPFVNKIEVVDEVTSQKSDWYFPDQWKKMQFNQKLYDAVTTPSSLLNENETSKENIEMYPPGLPSPCQSRCHQMTVTSEYNPICGSDGVTYLNSGKFNCAQKCGRKITGRYHGSCGYGAPKM